MVGVTPSADEPRAAPAADGPLALGKFRGNLPCVGLRPRVGPADASATADETFQSSPAATAEELEAIASNEVASATSTMPTQPAVKFELKQLTEDEGDDYNGDTEDGVRGRK